MRKLTFKFTVKTSIHQAYKFWIERDMMQQFFSQTVIINPKPFGKFEILFDMSAQDGQRGAEGMEYMALDEPNFISFTWNNPPILSSIRNHRTIVTVRFVALSNHETFVEFEHGGFGYSSKWDESISYFEKAWKDIVLPRYCYACETNESAFENESTFDNYKIIVDRVV